MLHYWRDYVELKSVLLDLDYVVRTWTDDGPLLFPLSALGACSSYVCYIFGIFGLWLVPSHATSLPLVKNWLTPSPLPEQTSFVHGPKMKETGAHDKVLRTYDLSPPDCNYR